MRAEYLRKLAGQEEIDYGFVMSALSHYAAPRDKITAWLKSKELLRVKKGLYVFGHNIALRPYSKEVLANLIYGPSAISMNYALSYYGLIPERVNTVTNITNNRFKSFSTPVGVFKYYYLNSEKYSTGIVLNKTYQDQSYLIATPEKALCDQIHIADKDIYLDNLADLEKYLLFDLRIDEGTLIKFKLTQLEEIAHCYHDTRINLLHQYIKSRK